MNESTLPLLIILPSGALLVYTFATLANPFAAQRRGDQVFYVRLGFMQRILVLRWYVLAILAINSVAALPGLEALNSNQYGIYSFVILLGTILVLMLPMRYVFFKEGMAIGAGRLRHWAEFESYKYTSAGAKLNPAAGKRGQMLYLSDVQRRALHPTLERFLGDGRGAIAPRTRQRRTPN